jgi:transposase
MQFIKCYLDNGTLLQCTISSGLNYKRTAMDWASYIREIMVDWLYPTYPTLVFSGNVEIDESMFGHNHKYHKGNPNVGYHIWIFGLVERDTNRIILYPVQDRKATTLLPLIKKHVAPGSRIFSDGWQAYQTLNDEGFQHFTVIHKHERQ